MAITRDKKIQAINEASELLSSSKLTVLVRYSGTSVGDLQSLRKQASDSGTKVRVIKNRLFRRALEKNSLRTNLGDDILRGQILYLFNDTDEVAPAQEIAKFAKSQPQVEFISGFNAQGELLTAEDLRILSILPSKDQLRGQLVGVLSTPLQGVVSLLNANISGLLNVLSSRAKSLN